MRILVDTHVLLWAAALSSSLPADARDLLEDTGNTLYCSTASFWKIATKTALRRQDFDIDLGEFRQALETMVIDELPDLGQHTEAVVSLPPIHKDPFDRILIAQSMTEPLVLLTKDAVLAQYWDGVELV